MVSFKLLSNIRGWGKEERAGVQRDPILHPTLPSPISPHLPSILFVKIKGIVVVGLCCILRKDDF